MASVTTASATRHLEVVRIRASRECEEEPRRKCDASPGLLEGKGLALAYERLTMCVQRRGSLRRYSVKTTVRWRLTTWSS